MWIWEWLVSWLPEPDIDSHLLEDEDVIKAVPHHWIVYVRPTAEAAVGLLALVAMLFTLVEYAWVWMLIALPLFIHAGWIALTDHMDRFVVTNMRVFRTSGVLSRTVATMPTSRILDITMIKPLLGRLLNFGHFVFESAAQDQGLRDIRYIGRPNELDKVLQRTVQQAGLRAGPRKT